MKFGNKDTARGAMDSAAAAEANSQRPRHVFRSDTRWGRSVMEWESMDAFLGTAEVESGVHSIPIGEFAGKKVNYDFLVTARPGTALLCHFHGNAPRDGVDPPFFAGLGVTSSITASLFVPSDPILELNANLSLAWHFGCDGVPLQAMTVCIVKKLQTILRAPRVVAWGGSGGGFAAIRVAKDIPGSIVFAWNPQTDITKYNRDIVNCYRRVAFPTLAAGGDFPSSIGQFVSLCDEDFRDGYKGRILYLQECTDWHVGTHLKPFLAGFCGKTLSDITDSSKFSGFVTDQFYLHLDHWGKGHVPPSKDVISTVLSLLSDVTANIEHRGSAAAFPGKVLDYIASTLSQHVPAA